MTDFTIERKVCANPDCGKEYDAKVVQCLGENLVMGGGFCQDCRKILEANERKAEKVKQDLANKGQRRLWRKRCGIPPKFQKKNFANFDQTLQAKYYRICLKYADEYPILTPAGCKSLMLFSEDSWGVGKTHLVGAIGHKILDRWDGEDISCPVLFVSEPELYTRIQTTYKDRGFGGETEADIIKQLSRVSLLIMDDVGKRSVADPKFVRRIMFSVIDGRYTAMLPLVLTANLNPNQLANYMGDAPVDRLAEMCGVFYKIEGDSYRIKE